MPFLSTGLVQPIGSNKAPDEEFADKVHLRSLARAKHHCLNLVTLVENEFAGIAVV
jgi:hypothetical protein